MMNKNNEKMIFDLKGNTMHREVHFTDIEKQWWLKSMGHNEVMRDLNFLKINLDLN